MCMSIGRLPKSSPPGSDSVTRAASGEQRSEHIDRRADALDEFVRRHGVEVATVGEQQRVVVSRVPLGGYTDRGQEIAHDGDIGDVGHVGQRRHTVGEQGGRHQLEH